MIIKINIFFIMEFFGFLLLWIIGIVVVVFLIIDVFYVFNVVIGVDSLLNIGL